MNNKVNYTFVGIMVLIIITLMFSFIIWLIRPNSSENFTKYYIYFNESVAGLNVNSPVKYKGVNMGKVLSIKISPKNYNEIQVLIKLQQNTPINQSTRATLNIQGVTGLVFINLSLGNKNALLLKKDKDKIMTIKTAPSLFNRVEKSLGGLTVKLSDSLDNLNKILNKQNINNLAITLQQTRELMSRASKILNDKTIKHFHNTLDNIDKISTNMNKMLPKITVLIHKSGDFTDKVSTSIAQMTSSYKNIEHSMFAFKVALKNGDFNFKKISQNTLKNLNISLYKFNNTLLRVNNIIKHYQNHSSAMLFEIKKQPKGPGER